MITEVEQTGPTDASRRPRVETTGAATSPRHGRAMLLGLCVLFAAWILVVPPFGGSDEHDHAFRAAAAARGEWGIDPVDATRGTGAFLRVPTDIVSAARAECQALIYTKDHDCIGTATTGGDRIVASGAGRYHPLFYAVIGTAALPFDGATALYAMRVATALIAAAFVWMSVRAASTWARSRWPYLGIAVACTPVAVYSSAIAAPNGVEMMSALAFWLSLVGLLVAPPERLRALATYAGISGATLATLRPLGPLWCLVAAGAVLLAVRTEPGRIRMLLRRPAVLAGALLVFVSALQATIWVFSVDALRVGGEGMGHTSLAHRLSVSASQLPAWILQSIAAFPLRDDASHPAVYACYLLLFGYVVTIGLRYGVTRERLAIVLVVAAVILFPYVTTVKSYDQYAAAWQGRYGLPVAIGIVVLATYAADRAGRVLRGPTQALLLVLFVAAQTISPAYTLLWEIDRSPQVHSSAWVQPSMLLTVVVAGLGSALFWWGAFGQDLPARKQVRAAD